MTPPTACVTNPVMSENLDELGLFIFPPIDVAYAVRISASMRDPRCWADTKGPHSIGMRTLRFANILLLTPTSMPHPISGIASPVRSAREVVAVPFAFDGSTEIFGRYPAGVLAAVIVGPCHIDVFFCPVCGVPVDFERSSVDQRGSP